MGDGTRRLLYREKLRMRFQAALFDLDGTLLDTLEDLADSANIALASLGFPAHPADCYRYFVGNGLETMVRRMLPKGRDHRETVLAGTDAVRREYARRWSCKTRPYPGIPALLDALTDRDMQMCVLSNKPDDFTRLTVAGLMPRWHFAVVRGARDRVPIKPDPTGALQIARVLGIHARDFLYLGDTATDMRTAVAAGMHPVGALWGFRTAAELSAGGAKSLIEEPVDLLSLID